MLIPLILFSSKPLHAGENSPLKLSVTVDSTQLAQNTLQLQQEWALRPKIGIGFSEGFGLHKNEVSYQFGLLSRYYLLGDFLGGLGAGGDISYTAYIIREQNRTLNGHLLAPSLLLMGKYIFDVGFTIEPSIGGQFVNLWATAPSQDSFVSEGEWRWIFGLRLGWSLESAMLRSRAAPNSMTNHPK